MKLSRRLATAAAVLTVSSVGGLQPASATPPETSSPAPSAVTATPSTRTQFGVSLPYRSGMTIAQSVDGYRNQFGALPVVRVFDSTPPAQWKNNATLAALGSGSAVIYSFQGDMDAIAGGALDAQLTSFLTSRPAGVKVYVVLHHEPEDEVAAGKFTTAQFRAATAHIAPVVKAAGGIPTTVLMAWTLDPSSGRNWRDYYVPSVEVQAYDAYNTGQAKSSYKSADKFVDPVLAVARETGKPFGWAELGSPCIVVDPTCAGRAAWLGSLGQAFGAAGAQFVAYWNRASEDSDLDFSLADAASVQAWRTQVLSSLNSPPVADASAGCTDLHCAADGSGSYDPDGSVASYAWSWGDGTSSTGAAATHDYAAGGTYPVVLSVTDREGATASTSRSVTVTPHVNVLPVSAFTVACQLTQCTLDGTPSTDADGVVGGWSWSFGDGTVGSGAGATHRFAAAGTYPVALTVTDDTGATSTSQQLLTVQARPIAFRASSTFSSGSATLLQVPVPAGVQVGDALLLKVSTNGTGSAPQVPAGWSELARQVAGTSLTVLWQHVATGADLPGTKVAVQLANPVKSVSQILAYANTADTSPASVVAATGDDALTSSHTTPAVPVASDDSWVVSFFTDKSSATSAWTAPAGLTVRTSSYGSGSGYLSTLVADEGGPRAAGAAPARTAGTDASSRAAMMTVVLAPATR